MKVKKVSCRIFMHLAVRIQIWNRKTFYSVMKIIGNQDSFENNILWFNLFKSWHKPKNVNFKTNFSIWFTPQTVPSETNRQPYSYHRLWFSRFWLGTSFKNCINASLSSTWSDLWSPVEPENWYMVSRKRLYNSILK